MDWFLYDSDISYKQVNISRPEHQICYWEIKKQPGKQIN